MQRRLSLLTPTGDLTLGNYLGALRQMAAPLPDVECFYGISDLHAHTTRQDPAAVRTRTAVMLRLCLAAGIDPDATTLFVQSHVPAHSELGYLLQCVAGVGELSRMVQYREKGGPDARAALLTYPTLMAADILLYRATQVPVGNDQRQHVELARDLAYRFNHRYGAAFTVPEIVTPATAARVMDLQDPTRKMSKSARSGSGVVYLLDKPELVRRKVQRAVTDSDGDVRYDPVAKPGLSNLLEMLAACAGGRPEELAGQFHRYGELKTAVADAVVSVLEPLQKRYADIDPATVVEVARRGAQRAREAAVPTLHAAQVAMGLR